MPGRARVILRVLLVDDEDDVASAVANALGSGHEIVRAVSRDEALALIESSTHFDVVVCDLRMPSSTGQGDLSAEHGKAVFAELVARRSGTPVWVCSGFADDDFTEALIRDPRSGDPFGTGESVPLVEKFRKMHLVRVVDRLRSAANALDLLATVEISTFGEQLNLSPEQERMVRLAARQHGASLMRVRQLSGGLSGARTLAVQGLDVHGGGHQVLNCVMKIDSMDATDKEARRFREGAASVLPATAFAPLFSEIRAGAGSSSALIYSLAAPDPVSLSALLTVSDSRCAEIVDRLEEQLKTWPAGGSPTVTTVDELNELLGAPAIDVATQLGYEPVHESSAVAASKVQVRSCLQHGDLHALNVLVDQDDRPILIDFARTTRRVAAYDAVTLEFSLLFHPELAATRAGWPTIGQARRWDDTDTYLDGCPVPEFLLRTRDWGHRVSLGDREYNATVFSYALRHFQFDKDHALAQAVADRACELILGI